MNTHDIDIELPPLRTPDLEDELTAVLCAAISWGGSVISSEEYVAAKQRFRAAVNAAIEADRQSRGEPVLVGWTVSTTGGGILHASKYTEYEAKRSGYSLPVYRLTSPRTAEPSRGEPVGYIMPTAIKQLKAGGNAIVGGLPQGGDVAVYLAPQPAEPVKVPSDKDILRIWGNAPITGSKSGDALAFARALLACYGHKGQP